MRGEPQEHRRVGSAGAFPATIDLRPAEASDRTQGRPDPPLAASYDARAAVDPGGIRLKSSDC